MTKPLHILLVEDHRDSAQALSTLLRRDGHTVQLADSVRTAKDAYDSARYDVVLCDLGLPDGDGCDLLMELLSRGPVPPAIAITGFGMDEDVHRCKAAGFMTHITKPLAVDQLQELLEKLGSGEYLSRGIPGEPGTPIDGSSHSL